MKRDVDSMAVFITARTKFIETGSVDVSTHTLRVILYRPGQPNWEYTIWKFQDFYATQILREINFGHFEAPKIAILTI